MIMSEKYRNNNNSDNFLPSRRTDGGKKRGIFPTAFESGSFHLGLKRPDPSCHLFSS